MSIKEEGEYNMCQAVKEMKEEAREEGELVKVLLEINWTVEMIAKQINLSELEVENIIQKIEKSENRIGIFNNRRRDYDFSELWSLFYYI